MENKQKVKILFIDDEENNLIAFKAAFRFDFHVLTAISADQALEVLHTHNDIEAIICDQRMPGKTGVELFEEVSTLYPKPVRMLTTGYTDIESVINAINKGKIFRYIRKPWNDEDIKTAIEEAHKFYSATTMLQKKNEELEEAYQELDKFAYRITHDLLGPLISVKEAMQMVFNEEDKTTRNQVLRLMGKSLQKLEDFILNISHYYRLKQGELTFTDVDLNELMGYYKDLFSVESSLGNIDFEIVYDNFDKSGEPFRTDEVKLKIILNNLLINAFKYQREENPDKWVRMEINRQPGSLILKVSDNGTGIPAFAIDNIFEMFYRATTQEPGSGFGLFNVKDAVTKLNGTIQVQSEENIGSVFTVTIPTK